MSASPSRRGRSAKKELERVHNLQTERAREEQLLDEELREVLDDAGESQRRGVEEVELAPGRRRLKKR